jgi:L-amino acid N-acyltransferase YncA
MRTRPVEDGDFEAIAEITNPFILKTAVHFAYEPVTPAELRATWKKHDQTHPYLVGTDDTGLVIGYAKAGPWRDRAAYDRTAEIGVYLREGHRGRGVGKALYGDLIAACRGRGFHSVIGGIALPNEPSVRLHVALGFEHTGSFRQVGWKFGAWHDVAFYQLML